MPSKPWALICPSSRGIGLQLTRHLLATTKVPILATTRRRSKDEEYDDNDTPTGLAELRNKYPERLHVVRLDVTGEQSIREAASTAERLFPPSTHHLHLAFAMTGVLTPERSLAQVDEASSLAMFRVNALGPLLVAKHFVPFLPRRSTDMMTTTTTTTEEEEVEESLPAHATWLCMSARVGSVADNRTGGWFSYRASKAAVNSLTKSLDVTLRARSGHKALAVAYHPGTVKTDLSRDFWASVAPEKLFAPEYAVERMVHVVRHMDPARRGACLDWKGDVVPP